MANPSMIVIVAAISLVAGTLVIGVFADAGLITQINNRLKAAPIHSAINFQ